MEKVRVYSWKPTGSINFGDEIGPLIVDRLSELYGNNLVVKATTSKTHSKILAVGSVLHEAQHNDVVWGVGVNSKNRLTLPRNSNLVFRAVRGPLTRKLVVDSGFSCPPIFGDPGLLFPLLFDKEIRLRRSELERSASELGMSMPDTVVIPNINDDRFLPDFCVGESASSSYMIVKPNLDPITVAAYISASKRVISSSLHGIVFAEAYGRSTYRMTSQYEPEFKYNDYYEGTGRVAPPAYQSIDAALNSVPTSDLNWDPLPLLHAFPLLDARLAQKLISYSYKLESGSTKYIQDLDPAMSPFGSGWAAPDSGAIWMTDTWSSFSCEVGETLNADAKLVLRVGTLPKGKGAFEVFRVVYNGKLVTSFQVPRKGSSIQVEIPLPQLCASEELELQFKAENSSSPLDYGLGDDKRSLGVWVSEFTLLN